MNILKADSNFQSDGQMHKKTALRILILITAIGFFLRIYITFYTQLPHVHRDTPEYFKQAKALVNGSYINYFPNGYPLIIAVGNLIFGRNIEPYLLWTNILMATCISLFVYNISKIIFKNTLLALVTIFLFAIYPSQINIVRWLTSEVPTTFFLTGAYFFYLRKHYMLSGLFFSATAIIRTEYLMVLILLILCELILTRKFNARLIIVSIMPLLVLGSYCYFKTGNFSISGHGKVNIMYSVTASGSNVDYEYVHKHPEIVTDKDALNEYLRHIKSTPLLFIQERMANLFELWGIPSSSEGNRGKTSRFIMGAGNLFLLFFGLAGLWQNKRDFKALILIIPFVVITFIHTLLLTFSRYTVPVEPFMIVLAMWMLVKLILVKLPKTSRQFKLLKGQLSQK